MRILDDDTERPVKRAWLFMTDSEATTLLQALLGREDDPDPQWHAHVDGTEEDGFSLTVAVYNPDALPSDGPSMTHFLATGEWPDS